MWPLTDSVTSYSSNVQPQPSVVALTCCWLLFMIEDQMWLFSCYRHPQRPKAWVGAEVAFPFPAVLCLQEKGSRFKNSFTHYSALGHWIWSSTICLCSPRNTSMNSSPFKDFMWAKTCTYALLFFFSFYFVLLFLYVFLLLFCPMIHLSHGHVVQFVRWPCGIWLDNELSGMGRNSNTWI